MQHLDIVHRTSHKGVIAESVIFPSTDQLLTSFRCRNVTSTVLLKLQDGSIWMLKAVGHAWTDRRIEKAAALALASANEEIDRTGLQQRLANSLAMPSLIIVDLISAHLMPEQWGITEFFSALSDNQDEFFAEAVGSIDAALTHIFKSFLASLNPQAKLHAFCGLELDTRVYNYLTHPDHRHYRMQFAATFPMLLPEIVNAMKKGEDEIFMRRAIDAGVPLIQVLTDLWGVAPRVIRHFIGKTPSVIGERWLGNAQGLARILDALPQEFFPGDDPAQWLKFTKAVALAQKLSNESPWKSAAALAWLRESAPYWLYSPADGSTPVMQGTGLIVSIGRLRKSLEYVLNLEIEERNVALPLNMVSLVTQVVEDLLLSILRKGRLPQVVARFDREVGQAMAEQNLEFRLLLGETTWPLFPGEFISSDGLRRVVTLTEVQSFRVHAQMLKICLWSKPAYIARCRQGKSFVLAFFDMASGEPQSTADISLIQHVSERRWSLQVIEHTGSSNNPVTDQCARALTEVLDYCNKMEVRRHIDRGQQLISDIEREGMVWAHRQANIALFAPALHAALGNAVYETAVRQVCAKAASGI